MEKAVSFNLIDEPWVWVLMHDGSRQELSLANVFEEAPRIKCLANDLPTQDFAILRMLLAILQRSLCDVAAEYDLPSDLWADLWEARSEGLPVDEIHSYLEEWHDCFDLFDANHPFMQVAGMHTSKNEWGEVKKIVADVPDGSPMFTMRTGTQAEELGFDEAARWLIHAQSFDASGIKSGVVGDPSQKGGKSYPIGTGWAGKLGGIFLEGETLAETIVLNFVPAPRENEAMFSDDDLPAWERGQTIPDGTTRTPSGTADVYTWQARRALLHVRDGVVDGVLLTNGDRLEPQNMYAVEPMTTWRRSKTQEKKLGLDEVYMPLTHTSERALWRGLESMIPSIDDERYRASRLLRWFGYLSSSVSGCGVISAHNLVNVVAVGFEYRAKSTQYSELVHDSMAFHSVLATEEGKALAGTARTCVKKTDEAVYALGSMALSIERASGADSVASGNAGRAASEIKSRAYFELDSIFRNWLSSLDGETDLVEAQLSWNKSARRVLMKLANDLIASAEPRSIIGRVIEGKQVNAPEAERFFYRSLDRALPDSAEGIGDAEEGSRNV